MSAEPKAAERRAALPSTAASKEPLAETPFGRACDGGPAAAPRGGVLSVPAFYTGMRSCLLCGKHRLMSQMQTKRLLGRAQWVCSPPCGTGLR